MILQHKKWVFQYFIPLFLIIVYTPKSFASFPGNSSIDNIETIETVFDAATSFMIPLFIFLSINNGMNVYLFCSFIILAMADMGLMILFTILCYNSSNDKFFLIYLASIGTLYIANYLLILKESKYFNKSFFNSRSESSLEEKYVKTKIIPLFLLSVNIVFLGVAVKLGYVDLIHGLFIIIPIIILFIVFVGFAIFYNKNKSAGLAHLRFLAEFMCSIIFVMITGPSTLWIKCYLSITIVELSLYLERAKPETQFRYRLDNLEQCRELIMNENEKGKKYVLEIHVQKREKGEEGEKDGIQVLSLNITDV